MSKHSYLALASASFFALATSASFAQTADETIDEVVVLSSPFKKSSDEIISQTHVITSSKIDKNAGTTLGDIIKTIPGVSVASHGPEVGRPVIRGLERPPHRVTCEWHDGRRYFRHCQRPRQYYQLL